MNNSNLFYNFLRHLFDLFIPKFQYCLKSSCTYLFWFNEKYIISLLNKVTKLIKYKCSTVMYFLNQYKRFWYKVLIALILINNYWPVILFLIYLLSFLRAFLINFIPRKSVKLLVQLMLSTFFRRSFIYI